MAPLLPPLSSFTGANASSVNNCLNINSLSSYLDESGVKNITNWYRIDYDIFFY